MTASPDGPALDVERILATLQRHRVDYLLVGGVSANAYATLYDDLFARSHPLQQAGQVRLGLVDPDR